MEIAIISGKGGTGKSCVSAAFATLGSQLVLADCDVDAANLHLIFHPETVREEEFTGSEKVVVDPKKCDHCGICLDYCNFGAISNEEGKIVFNYVLCDGCGLCSRVCPSDALRICGHSNSRLLEGNFRNGVMVYGRLAPGEENTGKLVNKVRERAKELSQKRKLPFILLDGPPGVGCPLISTISGVDKVLIVTEPGLSALHDMQRSLEICHSFKLPVAVLINKFDIQMEQSDLTEKFCREAGIPVVARVPYDERLVHAMLECKSIVEYAPESAATTDIRRAFEYMIHGS